MGDQLYLERFVRSHHEARKTLGAHFEIAPKTAQRFIDHFRDRLQALFQYDKSNKGYYYTDPTFQLPVIRISEEEIIALLISRKLITDDSAGSVPDGFGSLSARLSSLLSAIFITSGIANTGDIVTFRLTDSSDYDLIGEMVE